MVLTDSSAFGQIGRAWVGLHPCILDIPGLYMAPGSSMEYPTPEEHLPVKFLISGPSNPAPKKGQDQGDPAQHWELDVSAIQAAEDTAEALRQENVRLNQWLADVQDKKEGADKDIFWLLLSTFLSISLAVFLGVELITHKRSQNE